MDSRTRASSSEFNNDHSDIPAPASFQIEQDYESSGDQTEVKPLDDDNEDEEVRRTRTLLLDDDDDEENVVDFFAESIPASEDELKIASRDRLSGGAGNALLVKSVNGAIEGPDLKGILSKSAEVVATSASRFTDLPTKPRTAPSPIERRRDIRTPNPSRPNRFPRGPSPVPKDPIPKFRARPVPPSQPPLEPTRSFSPKLHNLLKGNKEWMQRAQVAEDRCKDLEVENRTLRNVLIRLADTGNCGDQVLSLLVEHGIDVDITDQEVLTEQEPPLKSALRDLAHYISMKKYYALGSRKAGKNILSQAIARAMAEDSSRMHPVSLNPHSTFPPLLNKVLATLQQRSPSLEPEVCRIRGPETKKENESAAQANVEMRSLESQPNDDGLKEAELPHAQPDHEDQTVNSVELKQEDEKSNSNIAKDNTLGNNKTQKRRPRTPAAVKTALFKTTQDTKLNNRQSWHDRPRTVQDLRTARERGKISSRTTIHRKKIHQETTSDSLSIGHLDSGIKFPVGGGYVHRTTNASGDAAEGNASVVASLQRQLEIHVQALQECINALVEEQQEKSKLQKWISQSRKQKARPLTRKELDKRTSDHSQNDTNFVYIPTCRSNTVTSCLTVPVDVPNKRPATSPALLVGGLLGALDSPSEKHFAYKCPEIQMLAPFAKHATSVPKKDDLRENMQIMPTLDGKYTNATFDCENIAMPRSRRLGWKKTLHPCT